MSDDEPVAISAGDEIRSAAGGNCSSPARPPLSSAVSDATLSSHEAGVVVVMLSGCLISSILPIGGNRKSARATRTEAR